MLLLIIHGELRHQLTCIGSLPRLHVGTVVRCQDTWLCCRYKLKIMFYFFKCKCFFVCIFIYGCHCCRLGCISTFKVWEARMFGHPIGSGMHARCFLYDCLVWAHQTTTETIWIGWIWAALSWPHMESTLRHVRLSGSTFTMDGLDMETA